MPVLLQSQTKKILSSMRIEKLLCLFVAQVCLNTFVEEMIVTEFGTCRGKEMI